MLRSALLLVLLALTTLGLVACERDGVPPLVEVSEVSPREIEVGDRMELRGAGFPQGRTARVTFRGTLLRPGQKPIHGASIEAEGIVGAADRIEIVVSEPLEERFCGHGDKAAHTTMTGEVEVAFSSSIPGAPPLVGVMHGTTLDISPSSVRASVVESRTAEGGHVLSFLGVTAGVATPRGLPIEKLAPGSPGDQAGFLPGDLISAVDGVHVRDVSDVTPASARSAQITVRHGDSGSEETKTVAMIGYAGERIPLEYGPAILVVGLALAVLVLLVIPAPAVASALELRLVRRLRVAGLKTTALALFGRGPRAIGSALASVLIGTFALGPHVIGAELDGAVLLVAAVALLLASRVSAAGGVRASARAALDVVLPGLVLTAAVAGIVIHGGALHLGELVRSQGGAPWEWSALRQPVATALAFSYFGALLVMLRTRDDARLLSDARIDDGDTVSPVDTKGMSARAEQNGRLLERLGLVVASGLGVAVFFGGWQLPGAVEARSTLLQVAAALLFVAKTWGVVALLLGAVTLATPLRAVEARRFMLRRLVPALLAGAALLAISRKLGPSESLEAAVGAAVVTALVLVTLRMVLRIRDAMLRPEPHASPFL